MVIRRTEDSDRDQESIDADQFPRTSQQDTFPVTGSPGAGGLPRPTPDVNRSPGNVNVDAPGEAGLPTPTPPPQPDLPDIDDEVTPEDVEDHVDAAIDRELADLAAQVGNIIDILDAAIDTQNAAIAGTEQRILGTLSDAILPAFGDLDQTLAQSFGNVTSSLDNAGSALDSVLSILQGGMEVVIDNNIIIDSSIYGELTGTILDIIGTQNEGFQGVLDRLLGTVSGILGDLIEAEIRSADLQTRALIDIAAAILHASGANIEQLGTMNDPGPNGTGWNWTQGAMGYLDSWPWLGDNADPDKPGESKFDLVFDPCDLDEAFDAIARKGAIDGTLSLAAWKLMETVGRLFGVLSIGSAVGQKELAEYSRYCSWAILQPGDAAAAWHRGALPEDFARDEIRMSGYDDKRVDALIASSYTIPDLTQLYSMQLRGLMTETEFRAKVRALGYDVSDIDRLEQLKFFIPPPQDLITMAVREVFTEEVARAQGQFDDFPEDFATYAEMQGISREWAERYWAAHWSLPSVQMGYEMLHRRVINEDQLRGLMQALDIMPGWRDELIEISYSPYTRVDIRRMHDLGILSDTDVYEAYRDIGYNDEKARNLTAFTLALNSDQGADTPPELQGLTRSTIIATYKDGTIDESEAKTLLTDIGIGETAAEVYIANAAMDVARESRQNRIALILQEFEAGAINLIEARRQLDQLQLTTAERDKAEEQLLKADAAGRKTPSRSDLDRMLKAGIINQGIYRDQMEAIGYANVWIDRYIQLAIGAGNV